MTSQGSPITRLRRALAGGDLLAARTAAAEVPHVDLDEAADLIMLIARDDPTKLDAAAVRFLGRACLERSFITLADAQLLLACLGQLGRADAESSRRASPSHSGGCGSTAQRVASKQPRGAGHSAASLVVTGSAIDRLERPRRLQGSPGREEANVSPATLSAPRRCG